MNCNGVKEHLVDFLYEEMSSDARTAFEEHLRGCPACKAEVASHRQALGNARVALSGPLSQEPPARVHSAVMEAAKAAAAKASANKTARVETKLGFFARLLRTPWLMPAFGAASVAAVVFLVRVLKNPEVIPGQRAQSIAESAEPPVANTASPPPTELWAVAPTSAGAGRAKDKDDRTETSGMKKRAGPRGGLDQPKHVYDDPLGGIGLDRPAPKGGRASQVSEEEKPRTRKKTDNNPLEGEIRDDDAFRAADKKRFAEPPPAPAVAQPSEETAAPAKSASAPARALAPAATPLPRLHAIGNSPAAAKELSKADSADFNDESLVKEQAAEPSLDESVRKADRLFANQNWSAAAEAYRNLLRHYPGHKDAAKWRARIDQSLVAEREAVGNKAAKAKRATETLEGPKL